jgi:RNA polymerase sigma-70 factor (ECF subfamily)
VALYAPLVMAWCRRWSVPEEDTADIFQEVFRSVAGHLDGFRKERQGDTFRGWLRTITRNKVCDYYRKMRNEPRGVGGTAIQMKLSQVPGSMPELDDDEDDDVEAGASDGLMQRALEQIRGHFHDRTWQAFWRVVVDGQPTSDVADELSMSSGAVRVAKSRVLQRLREELGELIE